MGPYGSPGHFRPTLSVLFRTSLTPFQRIQLLHIRADRISLNRGDIFVFDAVLISGVISLHFLLLTDAALIFLRFLRWHIARNMFFPEAVREAEDRKSEARARRGSSRSLIGK
jgi:hypothetical protein